MFKHFKLKLKNKNEILALGLLILITVFSTTYHNYTKNKITNNYNDIIDNIYFKKTLNYFYHNYFNKLL